MAWAFSGFALSGSASCLGLHEVRIYLDLTLHTYPGYNQRPGPLTLPRFPIAGLLPAGSVGPEGLSLAHWVRP